VDIVRRLLGLSGEVGTILWVSIAGIVLCDLGVSDSRLGECLAFGRGFYRFFFFLEVLIDCTALVVGRVISIAEDTPDIARAFLVRALTR
jgi:hypothetical protein